MRIRVIAAATLLILGAGCATTPKPHPTARPAAGIIQSMQSATLERADSAYATGQYWDALIEYQKVLDYAADENEHVPARIGFIRTCLKMNNPTAAVSRVALPTTPPATEHERELCAVLGEALLREGRTDQAEMALVLALANDPSPNATPDWRAPCHANLACAYLKNGKTEQAAAFYEAAAVLYYKCQRPGEGGRAAAMTERLRHLLNTAAPPARNGASPPRSPKMEH